MNAGRVGCVLFSDTPAEFTFVVAPGFLAGVPILTGPRTLASLRALAEGPRVEAAALPELLTPAGDESLSSVIVVQLGEAIDDDGLLVSVFVRGDMVADVFSVGGSRRIFHDQSQPMMFAELRAVTGLAIGSAQRSRVDPRDLGSGQAVGRGAISGNALLWCSSEPEAPSGVASGVASEVAPEVLPAAAELSSPGIESDPPVFAPDLDDTVLRAPTRSALRPEVAELVEDTILRRPASSALLTDERNPGGTPPAATVQARYGFRLRDGSEYRLDAVYLLGRHPKTAAGRVGAGRPTRLLQVSSATSSVSSTHLEIRQDGDAVVVTDVGSTNGTIVIPVRGRRQRLRAGESLSVRPGTRVDIGDGNIIEVLR